MLAELLKERCVKRGEFVLSSGETSNVYVDVKRGSTDPEILGLVAKEAADLVGDAEAVAGAALGGVPIATALSLETGLPLLIVRKRAKEYGTGERIEGDVPDGLRVVAVEDVTTTGGSLLSAVEALREAGASVDRAVVVVDREEGAVEHLEEHGVELLPLVTLSELLE